MVYFFIKHLYIFYYYSFYQKQDQNLDNALADAVNNIYISRTNFVPRGWYEKLWRDFKDLDRDH